MNPSLPTPGRARLGLSLVALLLAALPLQANLLLNGDMTLGRTLPSEWDKRWVGNGRLSALRDEGVFRSAPASLRLFAQEGSAKGQYYQLVSVVPGERLSASGWIKCEGADTTAQIGVQFFDEAGAPVGFTQVRYVAGDTDWTEGKIQAVAPAGAARAGFVLLLEGDGQTWLDDASLTVVGKSATATPTPPPPQTTAPAGDNIQSVATNLAGEGTLIAAIADFRAKGFDYGYEGWKDLAAVTKRDGEGLHLSGPAAGGGGIVYGSPAPIEGATHIRLRFIPRAGHTASGLQLKLFGNPESSVFVGLPKDAALIDTLQSRLVALPQKRANRVAQVQFQGTFSPAERFNLTLVDAAFVRMD